MIKTLSDLKRITVGTKLKLVSHPLESHKYLNIERPVKKVSSKWLCLISKEGDESFLYFPKAKDFEKTDKGFKIKNPAIYGNDSWSMEYEVLL